MKMRTGFFLLSKDAGKGADSVSQALTMRLGLACSMTSGIYSYSPLGARILRKLEGVVRQGMDAAGALEVAMPVLQPKEIWERSGRWDIFGAEMFKLESRGGRSFCLAPTHEEMVVELVRQGLASYRDMPFTVYQVGSKFRDELRPRGGILRTKEFLMKDAYSFDVDAAGLEASYQRMRAAYGRIFERLGVEVFAIEANAGEMGGVKSEEFIAPAAAGEDKFVLDATGKARMLDPNAAVHGAQVRTGIEVGHIFQLGTRYSKAMDLLFTTKEGVQAPALMGCYGIGLSRLLATIIEQHHDERGIAWPASVAPFTAAILGLRWDVAAVRASAEHLYQALSASGVETVLDDTEDTTGVKFKKADLLGVPLKLAIGPRSAENGRVEVEWRADGKKEVMDVERVVALCLAETRKVARTHSGFGTLDC